MGDLLLFRSPAVNTGQEAPVAAPQPAAQAERPRRKEGMASHAQGSLSALVDRYTEDRVAAGEASRRTALDQRLTLLQFSASYGDRPVGRMGESDIVRWMGTTADLRPSTRRNKLSVVKGFCRWLVRRGHVRVDPTMSVKAPRQPRTVPKVFEGDAVSLLLDGCPDARARLIVLLMVQMGLRCGEVAGLELGDIDGQLAVVQGKGGHQRVVPLPMQVRGAVADYLRERGGCAGPLIDNYQHPGRGLVSHTVSALVRDLCATVGIKRFPHDGISAHGLRRTCGSDLADRDVPLLDIAEAFGHTSTDTTRKYYVRHRATRLTKVMEGRWYGGQRIGETG